MLTDAIIKWRISKLNGVISKMNNVISKLNDFNNELNELKNILGENVLINDEIAYKEHLDDVESQSTNTLITVDKKIIPGLKNTIYKLKEQLKGE